MCITKPSIEDVKARVSADKNISARNFRAAVVIEGCPAFDEDWWMELRIGDVLFQCYETCDR
ncbi:unnamed protein product [Anisakis simplex]|uniref:MOSC domain-containing protein n=1 Tax=Anisakis simplex TaxID=6269 RepID=A0A3P6QFE4_ANISI|nr:unnamed protein product [Anisakis simplex]